MGKFLVRTSFFVYCLLTTFLVHAQDSVQKEKPQMADAMRSNGKIYVVVTVLMVILAGLFVYLINLDRKLSRMEKDNS
jgi:hypothetical protein